MLDYTKKQIDLAIIRLESRAGELEGLRDLPFDHDVTPLGHGSLAHMAYLECTGPENAIGDMLEAAARLRDGILPGTEAWAALETEFWLDYPDEE